MNLLSLMDIKRKHQGIYPKSCGERAISPFYDSIGSYAAQVRYFSSISSVIFLYLDRPFVVLFNKEGSCGLDGEISRVARNYPKNFPILRFPPKMGNLKDFLESLGFSKFVGYIVFLRNFDRWL